MTTAKHIKEALLLLSMPQSEPILYAIGLAHGSTIGILMPDSLLQSYRSYRDGWEDGIRTINQLGDPPSR